VIKLAEKFTIVLNGVDTLRNHSAIVQVLKEGLDGIFNKANRDLEIVISHGGDINVDFVRTIRLDCASQFPGIFTPNGPSFFDYNDPELAKFIGNAALHEIELILTRSEDHLRGPNNVLGVLRERDGESVVTRLRLYTQKMEFTEEQINEMVENIRTGNIGVKSFQMGLLDFGAAGAFQQSQSPFGMGGLDFGVAGPFQQSQSPFGMGGLDFGAAGPSPQSQSNLEDHLSMGSIQLEDELFDLKSEAPSNEDRSSSLSTMDHEVRYGDYIYYLAADYGFSDPQQFVDLVKALNPGIDFADLQPGEVIKVPNPQGITEERTDIGPKKG
jgi:hypothetical protein